MKFDPFGDCEIRKTKSGYEITHKANMGVNPEKGFGQYLTADDTISTLYERGRIYTVGPAFALIEAEYDRRNPPTERPQRLNSFVDLD